MKRAVGLLGSGWLLLLLFVPTEAAAQAAGVGETPDRTSTSAPPTTYRLTYTITERDETKELGTQHYAMTIDPVSKDAQIHLSSSVPVPSSGVTGTTSAAYNYVEIGLNISARIREFKTGLEVSSQLQQTELADDMWKQTGRAVIRHANLENTALLTLGKPVMLGSLDIPGSTRHLDINVVAELVH